MALALPREIAFPEDRIPIMNYIVLAFFTVDILINMRTSFLDEHSAEVINGRRIAFKYINSAYFIIDLISVFPFELLASPEEKSNARV